MGEMNTYERASSMEAYINKMARYYAAIFRVEEDDLKQTGWLSALHHAELFDESKGVGFYGYSHRGIAHKMREEAVRNFHQVVRPWDVFFSTEVGGMSLDQPASEFDDGVNVDALFGCDDDSAQVKMMEAETVEVVRGALAALPEKQRAVLHAYYFAGEKVHQTERSIGLCRERLRQIRNEGIEALRRSKAIQSLAA